jgi:hypothetical protein
MTRPLTRFAAVSAAERRRADLFFADLMGTPRSAGRRGAWGEHDEDSSEQALIEGPLTEAEWRTVILILSRREAQVGSPLTADPDRNALLVAGRIFCDRNALNLGPGDPLRCLTMDATIADPRVRALVPHVTARGPIADWVGVSRDARIRHVMTLLVRTHGYPVSGAAGIVGNLQAESGVLPQRVEGSASDTPMRARNFADRVTDFTAEEIMNRNSSTRTGPKLPGIGLAQWTSAGRRSGLFTHTFRGTRLGARILFDMDAQVDYLVRELRTSFPGVQAVVNNPTVTTNSACDEVVYNFEIPGAVLSGRTKLPRTDARVIAVFNQRRPLAQNAERIFNTP